MTSTIPFEITHFHLFAGLGGGARGFNRGDARVGNMVARFRCLGGVDVDPAAMRDFERLAGVPGTVLDLFDREQYREFHGREPGPEWREATPQDIQRAAGGERPKILFTSSPCKGFSGLLSESKSLSTKYQALNRLTLRGVWLMLEAWADDPPELVLFENVPRITSRGKSLLDQITSLLRSYGYATAETTHDCGELGGLAQSRKRFLLVARHMEKVPPLLYEPAKRPLRAVGDVLGRMLLPGDLRAGPMHRVPSLQWKTWLRLSLVEAGSDWRSLNKLAIKGGNLRDYLIVPTMFRGALGVRRWNEPTGAVAGESLPLNGAFSVADPRFGQSDRWHDGQAYGVHAWRDSTGAIAGQQSPGQGCYSVADPRCSETKHNNCFRVVRMADTSPAITGGTGPSAGGLAVADPRPGWNRYGNNLAVMDWHQPSATIVAGGKGVQGGWYSVADPRTQPSCEVARNRNLTVVNEQASCSVSQTGKATPETFPMPAADQKLVARIRSIDGTWHRPFTTLELAALQSLVDPEEQLELDGLSDQAWRERIGNAVPSDAAQAIASEMGRTLMLAANGETFALSAAPVWVRPVVVGLSVAQGDVA